MKRRIEKKRFRRESACFEKELKGRKARLVYCHGQFTVFGDYEESLVFTSRPKGISERHPVLLAFSNRSFPVDWRFIAKFRKLAKDPMEGA